MKIVKRILLVFSITLFVLLGFVYFYGYKINLYLVPPSPQKYVKVALNSMDNLGIYTDSTEWQKTKEQTIKESKNLKKYSETIPALQKAIQVAGGKHSFIESKKEPDSKNNANYIKPKSEIETDTLVLSVPEFSGNEKEAKEYATFLEDALHNNNYRAIIVDLRGNSGGNMSPMILGLSPILPDGNLFNYVDKKNNLAPVTLNNGEINSGGSTMKLANTKKIAELPIAVLIDGNTGSSGELTALCFEGLPNVTFFGADSAGYISANQEVPLYDGIIMQITSAFITDRTGKAYKNTPIKPDIETTDAKVSAINWIEQR